MGIRKRVSCVKNKNLSISNDLSESSLDLEPQNVSKSNTKIWYERMNRAFSKSTMPPLSLILEQRAREASAINKFIDTNQPGVLYISGLPGTGKSALMYALIETRKSYLDIKYPNYLYLNGMSISIDTSMAAKEKALLNILVDKWGKKTSGRNLNVDDIKQILNSNSEMTLLIIDEIDQLIGKFSQNSLIYQIFTWCFTKTCKLKVIGIANSMDLFNNVAFLPELCHFPPYTTTQTLEILKAKVKQAAIDSQCSLNDKGFVDNRWFNPCALEFCARKMANVGDLRKTLDLVQSAVCIAELDVFEKENYQNIHNDYLITLEHVEMAINRSSLGQSYESECNADSLTVHHKLILLSMIFPIHATKKLTSVEFESIYGRYKKNCMLSTLKVTPLSRIEVLDQLHLLESQNLLMIETKSGNTRLFGRNISNNMRSTKQYISPRLSVEKYLCKIETTPYLKNLCNMLKLEQSS